MNVDLKVASILYQTICYEKKFARNRILNYDTAILKLSPHDIAGIFAGINSERLRPMVFDIASVFEETVLGVRSIWNSYQRRSKCSEPPVEPDVMIRVREFFALTLAGMMIVDCELAASALLVQPLIRSAFQRYWERVDVECLDDDTVLQVFEEYPFDDRIIRRAWGIRKRQMDNEAVDLDTADSYDCIYALTFHALHYYITGEEKDMVAELTRDVERYPDNTFLLNNAVFGLSQISALQTTYQDKAFLYLHDIYNRDPHNENFIEPYKRAERLRAFQKNADFKEPAMERMIQWIAKKRQEGKQGYAAKR